MRIERDGLRSPGVRFVSAYDGGLVGCGALTTLGTRLRAHLLAEMRAAGSSGASRSVTTRPHLGARS